jgi:hypothetical protein
MSPKTDSRSLYAVYEGDRLLTFGTCTQCAEVLGVSRSSILHYASPSNIRRFKAGKVKRIAERIPRKEI